MAIPGMTAELADGFIAARTRGGNEALTGPIAPVANGGYAAAGGLRAATIIVHAITPSGARFVRRAVVSLTGVPSAPVRVLEWRQATD